MTDLIEVRTADLWSTETIAACGVVVALKLGDTVQVPKELMS